MSVAIEPWLSVIMPDATIITIGNCYASGEVFSAYDFNHNLFRLTAQGDVVWQVVRDENGRFKDTWEERLAELAKEKYPHHLPFMQLALADPEKRTEHGYAVVLPDDSNERGCAIALPDKPLIWRPGTMLLAEDIHGHQYDVDIETGVAKNITPFGHRPW